MRNIFLLILSAAVVYAGERPIVLKTSTLFDGKGQTLHNTIIVIEGSKIARIGGAAPADAVIYDLSAFTVSPGSIRIRTCLIISTARIAWRERTSRLRRDC